MLCIHMYSCPSCHFSPHMHQLPSPAAVCTVVPVVTLIYIGSSCHHQQLLCQVPPAVTLTNAVSCPPPQHQLLYKLPSCHFGLHRQQLLSSPAAVVCSLGATFILTNSCCVQSGSSFYPHQHLLCTVWSNFYPHQQLLCTVW